MGDVLMNFPALRLLRQTFPKAWIAMMADAGVQDLLKNNADIDELMVVDAPRIKTDLRYRMGLTRKLKRARFGLAVVSNADKHLHTMVFLAGIPERVGYDRKRGFLLTKKLKDLKGSGGRHEIDWNLDLIKLVSDRQWDGEHGLRPEPRASQDMEARIDREIGTRSPIVAVHTGTSNPRKRWPVEKFAELCARLSAQTGAVPVLIGGEEERPFAQAILAAHPSCAVDWTGSFTLRQLVAFLNSPRVKVLVSSDSGPVHVAWMSGVPVIALYAQDVPGSDPVRWGPRNPSSRILHKPIKDISVDDVYRLLGSAEGIR